MNSLALCIEICSGVATVGVAVAGFIKQSVALGQYKGKTDEKIKNLEERMEKQDSRIEAANAVVNAVQREFGTFSAKMEVALSYIQNDIAYIKEKVDAKEK